MAGPSFTFASYEAFTSRSLFRKEVKTCDEVEGMKTQATHSEHFIPPGRKRKAAQRFATGLVFLGVYSWYGGKMSYDFMLGQAFRDKAWWWR